MTEETTRPHPRLTLATSAYLAVSAAVLVLTLSDVFRSMATFPLIFGGLWALAGTLAFRRRRSWTRPATAAIALGVVLALAAPAAMLVKDRLRRDRLRQEALAELSGHPAPPLEHVAVVNDGAGTWEAYGQKGTYLVVNFWATWCAPCRKELPLLADFAAAHSPADVRVVGYTRLYGSEAGDAAAEIRSIESFLASRGVSYPSLVGHGTSTHGKFRVTSLPTTVLLDREGKVIDYGIGIGNTKRILGRARELIRG